ncbi:MAG: nucleotidyltransferase [Rhodospirillales bacterium RIFCSPLOWO2_12_FULL_58_28]|nr:MAG: nucleotidyltransferase [Rhodospirillales bacterium RIFCSPLOWO2_02_FULL_58_16]OHC77596.1 MAG: nucleotidyltransferase [Rhodospirillales bacterium RIFCSPLOWO2_12_FULL_58_28]
MSTVISLAAAIKRLSSHADDLRRQGIAHAAVFGSIVRGEARTDSDIDVLVDLDPDAELTLLDYVTLQSRLEEILCFPVDMVNRKTLKPFLRDNIIAEAVNAF